MQKFPWWTEAQKNLADELAEFVDSIQSMATELALKKNFSRPLLKEAAKKGYFGAMIPQKYGGHLEEWGVTGACIITEELSRAGEISAPLTSTMVGSIHQILHFGTEDQKQRLLPPLARGERLGAITITEPFVGSDASSVRTKGVRKDDHYIITGKKRYIGNGGVADTYLAYVKTSDRKEDRAAYRHLTAFVIEKGTPGFTVERIADIQALDGNYMGYLNFDDAPVPVSNRIGQEGEGWKIMTSGLNAERVVSGAQWLGWMRESLRYAVYHLQRRLQFGKPTIDLPTNQLKISDMVTKLTMGRLLTYYTAYQIDQGQETPLESAMVKLFNADSSLETAIEAIQCMGGDGLVSSYPVSRIMRNSKLAQIVAGTQEINRIVIFRQAMKLFENDLNVPPFKINDELQIPLPDNQTPKKESGKDAVLKVMAEFYRVHPGLHMSREELLSRLDMNDTVLDEELLGLEKDGWVDLYRDRKGVVVLARSTYEGLAKVHGPEYYRSFPTWVDLKEVF